MIRTILKVCLLILFVLMTKKGMCSISEVWTTNYGNEISKIISFDISNNGIKEILIISGSYRKKLTIFENEDTRFKLNYEYNSSKYYLDFQYYDINNSLLIKKSSLREEDIYSKIIYEKDKYKLVDANPLKMPLGPSEIYLKGGTLFDSGKFDVILTKYYIRDKIEWVYYLRKAEQPFKHVWMSPFKIAKHEGVQIFGDFNGDAKSELLIIPYDEKKGYLVHSKEDRIQMDIVSNLFQRGKGSNPINQLTPDKYMMKGNITTKERDELIFVETSEISEYGNLFKAIWKADSFTIENIYFGKYDCLHVTDMDGDGFDEIIISEVRGDIVETEEEPYIENHRDVVHIIKWTANKYETIWTSSPLGEITALLVDDVTGDGKKEIVVGNKEGDIFIFSQK